MAAEVQILGVGMHPWGKWGRSFVDYGLHAARAALQDAGVSWSEIDFLSGAATMRNGYPGYVAGATFAQALGWQGTEIASCYAACASGAQALAVARDKLRSGSARLALVVGADTTPKGFLAPHAGERPEDPDWLRFRLGVTNASYFGLYARRRTILFGTTEEDRARVKVKNSRHGLANPNARYRKECSLEEVLASSMVADPLRLLEICATSDGAAALVLASPEEARRRGASGGVRIAGLSTATPQYPTEMPEMPYLSSDSALAGSPSSHRALLVRKACEEAAVAPEDFSCAEVYDLSTALELDWYEDLGLCPPGGAEELLRSGATTLGGRVPVNPSGGLACFGEAVPAQGLAQVCELSWQLRGQAGARQVAAAKVGIAANQGLFGHGSAIILHR